MIAPRPTQPITVSIPALAQTAAMASLMRRFLFPQSVATTARSDTKLKTTTMNTTGHGVINVRARVERKSTFGQRLITHTAGLLVLYTYALIILVNGGWRFRLGRGRKHRLKLAASE